MEVIVCLASYGNVILIKREVTKRQSCWDDRRSSDSLLNLNLGYRGARVDGAKLYLLAVDVGVVQSTDNYTIGVAAIESEAVENNIYSC
jgi:hypothetical protein